MGEELSRVIQSLALERLRSLRVEHPDWGLDALARALGVSLAGTILDLALAAGFGSSGRLESTSDYGASFGTAAYGATGYGSRRDRSVGSIPVTRLVSAQGQTSYGGLVYTLGRRYRGRLTNVVERNQDLVFLTPGLPTVTRLKRRKKQP